MAAADLLIGGTSIQTYGTIADFSGIFSTAPMRGGNVVIPGQPGEVFAPKVAGAYDFTVPLVLRASVGVNTPRGDVLTALAGLRTMLGSGSAVLALSRVRPLAGGTTVTETCSGEYVEGLEPELVGFSAARVAIVLRNLSGGWT